MLHTVGSFSKFDGSFLSADEISRLAVVEVNSHLLHSKDDDCGVMDSRMGASISGGPCTTCGHSVENCWGHFGKTTFPFPVYNPLGIKYVNAILQSTCYRCSKILVADDLLNDLCKKFSGLNRLKEIKKKCVPTRKKTKGLVTVDHKECPHCHHLQPVWKTKMSSIQRIWKIDPERFRTHTATVIQNNTNKSTRVAEDKTFIAEVDAYVADAFREWNSADSYVAMNALSCKNAIKLGIFKPSSRMSVDAHSENKAWAQHHPKNMMFTVMLVAPLSVRFSITLSRGMDRETVDDLTLLYVNLVKCTQRAWAMTKDKTLRQTTRKRTKPNLSKPKSVKPKSVKPKSEKPKSVKPKSVIPEKDDIVSSLDDEEWNIDQVLSVINDEAGMVEHEPFAKIGFEGFLDTMTGTALHKHLLNKDFREMYTNLQYSVSAIITNEPTHGIPIKHRNGNKMISIKARAEGKEGRFRGDLMGNRTHHSSRTVITCAPHIDFDEILLGSAIANRAEYKQTVTKMSRSYLKLCIFIGYQSRISRKSIGTTRMKHVHEYAQQMGLNLHELWDKYGSTPGASRIVYFDGRVVSLRDTSDVDRMKIADALPIGAYVYRHYQNGDLLLFNRQPSLHKYSICAFRARVSTRCDSTGLQPSELLNERTIGLPPNVTKPFNAGM